MTTSIRVGALADHPPITNAPASRASDKLPPVRLPDAPVPTGVPLATLRDIWFNSHDRILANGKTVPGNGFASAFLKLGRAVYVDVAAFHAIWRAKQAKEANRV